MQLPKIYKDSMKRILGDTENVRLVIDNAQLTSSFRSIDGLDASYTPNFVVDSFNGGDRRFYLCAVDDVTLIVRVCDAGDYSGYDKFAVITHFEICEEGRLQLEEQYKRMSVTPWLNVDVVL